jgi:hypothetical protein
MLRTCQSKENEDNEKKPPTGQPKKSPRNTRFTTDYDGSIIMFRKKKDENQTNVFNKVFIT